MSGSGRLWYRALLLGATGQSANAVCSCESQRVNNDPIRMKQRYDTLASVPQKLFSQPSVAELKKFSSKERRKADQTNETRPSCDENNDDDCDDERSFASTSGDGALYASEIDATAKNDRNDDRNDDDDDAPVPFTKDVVGAHTCYGIEPQDFQQISFSKKTVGVDRITGSSYCKKKINQDRGGVFYPYGGNDRSALFAVYDGHGEGGERVAEHAMVEVEKRLRSHSDFENNIDKSFKETFLSIDQSLKDELDIDCTFCGSTACLVLVRGDTLHIANVGDSRAVLCRRSPTGGETNDDGSSAPSFRRRAVALTQDQNPDLPEERRRIERSGGFVSSSPEPGVSSRVWIDETNCSLGLAMSRSIGDSFLKKSGVVAEPVVTSRALSSFDSGGGEDEFIVLASDGVWEHMGSDEVVRTVGQALDDGETVDEACRQLIITAALRWKIYDYNYRDDITAIVVRIRGGLIDHFNALRENNGDEQQD